MTRRESKRIKAGRNSEKGKPGVSIRSYCPECPMNHADPQFMARTQVGPKTRIGRCPNGHTWTIAR